MREADTGGVVGRFELRGCAQRGWLAALLVLACIMSAGGAAAQERVRRVLLLYPYDNTVPATSLAGEAARKRLAERTNPHVEIYSDFLDLVRFPEEAHLQRMARLLADKYSEKPLDLIIALNTEAQRFATRYREVFAPNVPVIFCCVTRALLDSGTPRPADVTGIVHEYDMTKTLGLARRLQPDARNLVYIGGASEMDRRWNATYGQQLRPFEEAFNTTYLVGLPHEDLLRRVAQLPRDTIVLIGTIFTDGTGRQFVPRDAVEDVARHLSAPLYTNVDPILGRGIVGGHMPTFEGAGTEVAELALEILDGADPKTIAPRSTRALQYRVDERQLRRWGLSEASLPEGTLVYFRQPSLWEQHRDVAITAAAVILLQASLITAMVIQVYRRKRAERAMQTAQAELARVARHTTMGQMTASIAHEVNQPLAAIVASSNAGLRWLNNQEPNLEQARAAFTRITKQGHRAGEVIATVRAMFKKNAHARSDVDINQLVNEVLALLRGELEKGKVTVRTWLSASLPPVQADRVQLQQVILNLVVNAVEAMTAVSDRERVLKIRSEPRQPSDILLTVEDSGAGIAPEHMDKLFEAFYTTKPQGMGLGLSICHSIVESHGGRLSASRAHPHGAVFQIALPIESRD
jgi:signal transduction histidine kinase